MWKRIVFCVLLAVVARHLLTLLTILGVGKTLYHHKPGECNFVSGIESGAEEMELLSDGTVLISAGYLNFKERVEGAPRGHLYAYDINNHDDGAKELNIRGDYDVNTLHPHGISAYEDKTSGKTYLYMINHRVGFDTVDIFDFDKSSLSLSFIKSIRDPLAISVNNLIATGRDEFYITNEARTLNPRWRFWEDILMLNGGCVLFCTAEGCRMVSEAINSPNGIDLSNDGRYLYVNQPYQNHVMVFERNPTDNSLKNRKPISTIALGSAPDNNYVDASGNLWTVGFPMGYKALEYLDDPQKIVRVPSHVLRVKLGSGPTRHDDVDLYEVYCEDGRNLTMATSVIYHQNVLLIGTLHEKMMRCDVLAI